MTSDIQYIAIDIAKHTLQVQSDSSALSVAYNPQGLKQLRALIQQHQNPMVIAEASGGYERKLMRMLMEHHIAVALINPRLARAFAQSEGIKAKTDPIDARMLLRFAKEKQPSPSRYIGAEREQLAAQVLDNNSMQQMMPKLRKTAWTSVRKASMPRYARCSASWSGSWRFKRMSDALVRSNEQMHAQFKLMQDVSGVGRAARPNTAWSILAYLAKSMHHPNELVARAGRLGSLHRDSGKYKGKRRIQGGRAKVRKDAVYGGAIRRLSTIHTLKPMPIDYSKRRASLINTP